MILLDRYILRSFLVPFLLCFFGFLAIWLVVDLQNNTSDFLEAQISLRKAAYYYATQVPQFMMICIPVGLLLSLLFSLSKMSRSNEIIAMLTAGQSLTRLLLPLLGVGLLLSGVCVVVNYAWAPHAYSAKKDFKAKISKSPDRNRFINAQIFRNRADRRSWFVTCMDAKPDNSSVLQGITILEQNQAGTITSELVAESAKYKPETKTWQFFNGSEVIFAPDGTIQTDKQFVGQLPKQFDSWSETPWRIASSNLDPQGLSVPELRNYLRYNADFPPAKLAPYRTYLYNRWALPFQCLVVVLFAGPLSIVFSRRGVLTGIAGAIFLFAGMMFFNALMLAIGKGNRVDPVIAAWLPIFLFTAIGIYLLYLKGTNREFPKFSDLFSSKPKL